MADISFGKGDVIYTINGGEATVVFNPTDMSFIERVFATFDELDAKQEHYSTEIDKAKDNAAVFKIAREMDENMRSLIDTAFESEVCAPVFGKTSVYALADGLPLWVNFMLAVIDEMDSAFVREKKATNPRIQKYTQKYNKK